MIRVLIADDHDDVRRGVAEILAEAPDIVLAGEASTGREALQAVRKHNYDVLLLDITMPEFNGFDVLEQLQDRNPEQRILILSMHPEEEYAVRSLTAGADGYVMKESASDELIVAIRKVSQGGKYIAIALAEKTASRIGGKLESESHEKHSDRE